MNRRSIILIGGPDAGKTNYVARLWHALNANEGALHAVEIPADISFVEDMIAHLFEGKFAPRSHLTEDSRRDFVISVAAAQGGPTTELVIPDNSGELWRNAVLSSEIGIEWMEELRRADGAVLFVRVLSNLNEQPLDWVTAGKLLGDLGVDEDRSGLPTQVMLCELLRFLEVSLAKRSDGGRPRVAIVVSAWDMVDDEIAVKGPECFLASEYPMLAGKLHDMSRLEVRTFGLSVVGGDIGLSPDYREEFLDMDFGTTGWVVTNDGPDGKWHQNPDVTLPIAWVIGS
ncbi:hypothetical protein BKM17_26705 [Pseudomonas syringae group genomosp. 3]|uniref:TRAFAC clade GTPase domain-containing protein n=1 Tax=Pseudomonas syringae group genomosp. 3 TaxID=251701 RepID=UPI000621526F|nr:hypothetical protein [Pseudomonas syringae group genomosp. 3]KKI23329.1 hypothetical protein WX98_25735 [Pseudomonas syringae pv. persicae]POD68621.1 hypothetical protein BKM17_26705 [Pseudomonas syringae group genomosp. 3]